MVRVMHHGTHQEEKHMARLSVTLDDKLSRELHGLRLDEARDVVRRAMEILPADEAMGYARLSRSLEELGQDPASSAAVVRQATAVFFDLLREAHTAIMLQSGYQSLASDQERRDVIGAMSKRPPLRWNDEH